MRLLYNASKTRPLRLAYKSGMTSEETILTVVYNRATCNSMKIIN